MSNVQLNPNAVAPERTTRLVNVGRVWFNAIPYAQVVKFLLEEAQQQGLTTVDEAIALATTKLAEQRKSTNPILGGNIDYDMQVALAGNDRTLFFQNEQREGKRDADLRTSIEVDAATAEQIFAAQKARKEEAATQARIAGEAPATA